MRCIFKNSATSTILENMTISNLRIRSLWKEVIMAKNTMGLKTKSKILDAAQAVFNEKGFDNTSVDEIAAKADITKAMVYYHFDSKESIMIELIGRLLVHIKEELGSKVVGGSNTEMMFNYIGEAMNLWRDNKELGLFIASRGIKDKEILSRIIKIAKPFLEMLINSNNSDCKPSMGKMETNQKLFCLLMFNTLPMIFLPNIIDNFLDEFDIPNEILQKTFQEEFFRVLNTICGNESVDA